MTIDEVMDCLEGAKKRRKEIKKIVETLVKEYNLIKKEIELHQKHLNRLVREKEYSQFLDTVKIDDLRFP